MLAGFRAAELSGGVNPTYEKDHPYLRRLRPERRLSEFLRNEDCDHHDDGRSSDECQHDRRHEPHDYGNREGQHWKEDFLDDEEEFDQEEELGRRRRWRFAVSLAFALSFGLVPERADRKLV